MSTGFNKIFVIGNIGNDLTLRYSADGTAFLEISLGQNKAWIDKTTGERNHKVCWHHCFVFKKLAEDAAQYLKKGSRIHIEGEVESYVNTKDQQKPYLCRIKVHAIQYLDPRPVEHSEDLESERSDANATTTHSVNPVSN